MWKVNFSKEDAYAKKRLSSLMGGLTLEMHFLAFLCGLGEQA